MAALGLHCFGRAFSSCGKQGILFVTVRGLFMKVPSLVAEEASVVAVHGLSSCGAWALLLHGTWNLPGAGIKPESPALAGRFLSHCATRKCGGSPNNLFFLTAFLKKLCYWIIWFLPWIDHIRSLLTKCGLSHNTLTSQTSCCGPWGTRLSDWTKTWWTASSLKNISQSTYFETHGFIRHFSFWCWGFTFYWENGSFFPHHHQSLARGTNLWPLHLVAGRPIRWCSTTKSLCPHVAREWTQEPEKGNWWARQSACGSGLLCTFHPSLMESTSKGSVVPRVCCKTRTGGLVW